MRSFVVCVYLIVIFLVVSSGEDDPPSVIEDVWEVNITSEGPKIKYKSVEDSDEENNSNDSRVRAAIKEENENFHKAIKEIMEEVVEYKKTLETLPNYSRLSQESKGLGKKTVVMWKKIAQKKCFCEKGFPGLNGENGDDGYPGFPGLFPGQKGDPGTIERSESLC